MLRSLIDITELSSAHLAVIWWFVQPTDAFSKLLHKQCQRELIRRGDLILKNHAVVDEWEIDEWHLSDEQRDILIKDFDENEPGQSLENDFFEVVLGYENPWRELWEDLAIEEYEELKKKGGPDEATSVSEP
jgi:hypothetical protein